MALSDIQARELNVALMTYIEGEQEKVSARISELRENAKEGVLSDEDIDSEIGSIADTQKHLDVVAEIQKRISTRNADD